MTHTRDMNYYEPQTVNDHFYNWCDQTDREPDHDAWVEYMERMDDARIDAEIERAERTADERDWDEDY